MKKISVIIPFYNVKEEYIRECLDSILNQAVGRENLELILVDDCSTDDTLSVLQHYEEQYPEQIMLIACDQNGRQGTARNIGLQYASGDYISFVDSDDYIVSDMYEQLVAAAENCDGDIVQFRYTSDINALSDRSKMQWSVYDYANNRKAFLLQDQILNNSCTTKLYRRELLEQAGTRYGEGVSYEEPLFTYPLRYYVNRVCVTNQPFYYYRPNEDGTTIKTMSNPESIVDHLQVQMTLYEQMRESIFYQEYRDEIDLFFLHSFCVEAIYFFAKRNMVFPVSLFREMANYVNGKVTDWKKNAYVWGENLAEERQVLWLLDYQDRDDEWLQEQISHLFYKLDDERIVSRLRDFTEAIKQGVLYDDRIFNYDYLDLHSLFAFENKNENSTLYPLVYDAVMKASEQRISNKRQKGEKVKVTFLPISAAEWPAEKTYRMFEADDRFEVVVVPMPLIDRDYEFRKKTYEDTLTYFVDGDYNIQEVYDKEKDICFGWQEIGGIADIVIYVTLWSESLPIPYQIEKIPFGSLNIYIPYGFSVGESINPDYVKKMTYNRGFVNMLWRMYAESDRACKEFEKYELLQGKNVVLSGYTKMDYFYEKPCFSDEEIRRMWKMPGDVAIDDMKRVIIAPHYSVGKDDILACATFALNKDFLLDMAIKYQDKVSFVLKLHPNLRLKSVKSGVFATMEDFDNYLDQWRVLPNARVIEEGGYLELFASSDGMILDSMSFIAEYMYVDKPLLFLQRDTQRFNPLGRALMEIHYKVPGDDFDGIDNFLKNVIIGDEDINKAKRELVFREELDYKNKTGKLASDFVYEDVLKGLGA